MTGFWTIIRGRLRRLFRTGGPTRPARRSRLGVSPLEERIVPALSVAIGDLTGDGVPDLAIGQPDGTLLTVNGADGSTIKSFQPFGEFNRPLNVAIGDITGDGRNDLIVGAGGGGGPRVRVFDGATGGTLLDILAFEADFRGGVSVAAGDVTGDGQADLIVAPGQGGGPRVKVISGATSAVVRDFFALEPEFRGGVSLSAADFNGDGQADMIVSAGRGGGPRVRVVSGMDGSTLRDFFVGNPNKRDGAAATAADVDGNLLADVAVLADGRLSLFAGENPTPFRDLPMPDRTRLAAGDLSGNGFSELLAINDSSFVALGGEDLAPTGFAWPMAAPAGFAQPAPASPPSVFAGQSVFISGDADVTVRIERLRAFTNKASLVGLFPVDDASGRVGTLLPGDAGWLDAALEETRRVPFVQSIGGASAAEAQVPGGKHYGIYLIQGTERFTSFEAEQFRLLPRNRFAAIDAPQGGFGDYQSIVGELAVNPGQSPPPPPPGGGGNFTPNLEGWVRTDLGGSENGKGTITVADGIATLVEGDSFRVGLSKAFTIPSAPTEVRILFDAPLFDTASSGQVKDAFEIAVLGADGSPLALPIAAGRDAAFNWTESLTPLAGPAATFADGTAAVSLAGLPAGTLAQLVLRLVNNDSDNTTQVRVRRVDFVAASGPAASGAPAGDRLTPAAAVLDGLEDVTPSVRFDYGRTTLTEDRTLLTADLSLRNSGTYPLTGNVVVAVGNVSDPAATVQNPDGFLADGRPYFNFTSQVNGVLLPGGVSASRQIQFTNPNRIRFTYDLAVLAGLNRAPVIEPIPSAEILAGVPYAFEVQASDPDGHALSYRLPVAPVGMSIDAAGRIAWVPGLADLGTAQVLVEVADALGAKASQVFALTVREEIPNRPPVFTSTPPTDAVASRPFEVLTFASGSNPQAVAAGDFGQGVSIVSGNERDQQLGLLAGLGGERFGASVPLDLGEPGPGIYPTPFITGFSVPLGIEPGTIQNTERDIWGILAEDVNGDGNADVIAAIAMFSNGNPNNVNEQAFVTLRLGNGDGTFRDGWQVQLPGKPARSARAVTLRYADATGDGVKDLIVTAQTTSQTLVYQGIAGGTFATTPIITENDAGFVTNMQVGDMDGDGKLDLVFFENFNGLVGGRHGFSVQFGNGDGSFGQSVFYAQKNTNAEMGYLVDANGDGALDVVRLDYNRIVLETYLNDGTGSFGPVIESDAKQYGDVFGGSTFGWTANINSATFADFTGDGKMDALVSGPYYQTLLHGQGDGTFGDSTSTGNVSVVTRVSTGRDDPRWPGNLQTDGSPVDLNGDGIPDAIHGDLANSRMIFTLLGDGTGTFTPQGYNAFYDDDTGFGSVRGQNYNPFVTVADFNNDGVMDVLTGSRSSGSRPGSVGLILGASPGTLRAPAFITDYAAPNARGFDSLAADFDGDGITDLLRTGYSGFSTILYFAKGKGDGSFEPMVGASAPINDLGSPIVTDMDGDGNLDIAFIDGGSFRVFMGLGNGAFSTLPTVNLPGVGPPGVSHMFLHELDINSDGHPDFVARFQTGNIDTNFNTAIRVFVNDPGANKYTILPDSTNLYSLLPRPGGFYIDEGLGSGDLNGNGKLEFFAFYRENPSLGLPSKWIVWEHTGSSGSDAADYFTRTVIENPAFIPPTASVHEYVVADFNGDGMTDIAYSDHTASTVVMLGNGDFTFRDPVRYANNGFHLRAGDVDGDGHLDLIADWGYGFISFSNRPQSSVLHGDGTGRFVHRASYHAAVNSGLDDARLIDLDGDGKDELLGLGGLNHSEAWMARRITITDTTAADLNGDGKLDSLSVSADYSRVKILLGNGDNTFTRIHDLHTGAHPVAVHAADITGDGTLEIITANKLGKSLSVFTAAGGGYTRTDLPLEGAPAALAVGDIDGDGKADLAAAGSVLTTFVNGAAFTLPLGFAATDAALADVTGDGKLDAIITDGANRRLVILPGKGDGTFDPPTVIPLSESPGKVAAADLNADGKLDLIITLPDGSAVGILFNRGDGRFTTPQRIGVGNQPAALAVHDLNADGRPDVLVANSGDDTISAILNRFDPARLYRYTPTAIDPDGDPVVFELLEAPGGMLLDAATNEILWAPMPDQIGLNSVTIQASDGRGGIAEQGFSIAVAATVAVDAPAFIGEPIDSVRVDEVYRYQPRIAPTDEPVRFSLMQAPAGITIDAATGELHWDQRREGLQLWRQSGTDFAASSITASHAASLAPASVTAEGWFRMENVPGAIWTQLLAKLRDNSNQNLASFGIENFFGTLRATIGKPGETLATVTSSLPITFGDWMHLALTFDDATKQLSLYVNGELAGSAVSPESIGYGSGSLVVGSNNQTYAAVADIRVWDHARSPEEIRAGMFSRSDAPGRLVDYRFTEADWTVSVIDSSGLAHHGVLENVPDLAGFPFHLSAIGQAGSHAVVIRADNGRGGIVEQSFTLHAVPNLPKAVSGKVAEADGSGVSGRTVFVDLNANNRRDPGEPHAATNSDGEYVLTARGGIVRVALESSPGWLQTAPAMPFHAVDLSGPASGVDFLVSAAASGKPVFLSLPVTDAEVPGTYVYRAFAQDPDGGPVEYGVAFGPAGLTVDPVSGYVQWTPREADAGGHDVILKAVDAAGEVALQRFVIAVTVTAPTPPLTSAPPPRIVSTPPTESFVGGTYVYVVGVANPGSGPLSFSLVQAPAGMAIDAASGVIDWSPTATGTEPVIVRVADGAGNFATQAFAIEVSAGAANLPPLATSLPPLDATVGTSFVYTFAASDPEGQPLAFSVVQGPDGFTIDAATGMVNWIPQSAEIGSAIVVLKAADPQGAAAVQSFIVDVRAANSPPVITSTPPAKVSQGARFSYDVAAADPDFEPLFYSLLAAPAGMTIDGLGRVRWQTDLNEPLGNREVSIRVTDGRGGMAEQNFTLEVAPDTVPPKVVIILSGEPVLFPWTTQPARVRVIATDDVCVTGMTLLVDGQETPLAADGTASVYFSAPGNGKLQAFAVDAAGNKGSAIGRVNMRSGTEDGSGNPAPIAAITNISEGDTLRGFVSIEGTADSPDFNSYALSYRRADQPLFTTIHTSTTPVVNGSLGMWDTTLIENDSYVLKLEVFDTFGSFAAQEVLVGVSGSLKLGNFRLSFADMTIPVAGIPVTLARTYDTLRADRSGDFGFGWRMEYRNTDLRTSLPQTGLEDVGLYTPFRQGVKVFLTLPGGQREGYTFTPTFQVIGSGLGQLVLATPRFTPDPGVRNTLSVSGGTLVVNDFGELFAGGMPWNPGSSDFGGYTLATPAGIVYRIGGDGLLTTATDRDGNTLSFTDAGVSGQGVEILFERDTADRITKATDPAGKFLLYGYSSQGDLVQVTDREGHVTQLTYRPDRPHYLDKVIDPLGREGIRAVYGPDGRLTGLLDANGNGPTATYDPENSLVTTFDPLGKATISEYDARGNVVQIVNALGHSTKYAYDADDRLIEFVDALGSTTTIAYDAAGRPAQQTDPLGRSTFFLHNAAGDPVAMTDALGRTSKAELDSKGRATLLTGANGLATALHYDAQGNVTKFAGPSGRFSELTFDSQGRTLTAVNPLGSAAAFAYDTSGNLLESARTDEYGTRVEWQQTYDANGRVISSTDELGIVTQFVYDAAGQLIQTVGAAGVTAYEYDAAGRRTKTTDALGRLSQFAYDAVGRLIASTDPAGRTTRFEFDDLGRKTAVILPDGTHDDPSDNPRIGYEYDALGRLTKTHDARGNVSENVYDAGGRKVAFINAAGHTTTYAYDLGDRLVSVIDPLGRTTHYSYDASDRLVAIQAAGTTVMQKTYDAFGRVLTTTDADGYTFANVYDIHGRLVQVTEPGGAVTKYAYDSRGLMTARTDALGRTTAYSYDAAGRLITTTLPLGQAETIAYDALGRIVSVSGFDGKVTQYSYDTLGRVTALNLAEGNSVQRTYTTDGRIASMQDQSGTISYGYAPDGRLAAVTDQNNRTIAYEFDANGNRTVMTAPFGTTAYTYDSLNRLASVVDPNGFATTYTYNAAGELVQTQFANGTTEFRAYNALGQLISVSLKQGAVDLAGVTYTRSPAGRILSAVDLDGTATTYLYDAAARLSREAIAVPGEPLRTIDYHYDAVGNRLARIDSADGMTTYSYDANDRLLASAGAESMSYSHDAAGRRTSQTGPGGTTQFTYDSRGLMLSAATGGQTVNYQYDANGRLAGRTDAAGSIAYLIDTAGTLTQRIAEFSTTGLQAFTTYGRDPISTTAGGTASFYFTDGRENVLGTMNAAGSVTATQRFDAFGNLLAATGDMPLGYRGEARDAATGLVDLRARVLDPGTGQFLSRDPARGLAELPVTFHPYLYASADPVNSLDPTGLFTIADLSMVAYLTSFFATSYFNAFGFKKAIASAAVNTGVSIAQNAIRALQSEAAGSFHDYSTAVFNYTPDVDADEARRLIANPGVAGLYSLIDGDIGKLERVYERSLATIPLRFFNPAFSLTSSDEAITFGAGVNAFVSSSYQALFYIDRTNATADNIGGLLQQANGLEFEGGVQIARTALVSSALNGATAAGLPAVSFPVDLYQLPRGRFSSVPQGMSALATLAYSIVPTVQTGFYRDATAMLTLASIANGPLN